MKHLILALALTMGCEVYVEAEPHPHGICYESEPYTWRANYYHDYYNNEGDFVGECAEWYVGQGWYEEWCNWDDVCGWEFVAEWNARATIADTTKVGQSGVKCERVVLSSE